MTDLGDPIGRPSGALAASGQPPGATTVAAGRVATPPGGRSQGGQSFQVTPPSINLPKGGGAIRGIGETFSANPVTGTASMSVPIATSPGRSGFGPQLSLSYDSGAGNGPFGFGWQLALPTITRTTDKAIPLYLDAAESDVYILSGSEDLVPLLVEGPPGIWQRDTRDRTLDGVDYRVERYRPRVEGLFARIERWTRVADGDIRWRSISRDNVTTWYGRTAESRIADPADPSRVFSWLICETFDDKGNASVYEYAAEDSANVDAGAANEANRTPVSRSANRYLKRIKYGNAVSRLIEPDLEAQDWLFEVVFDYAGEGTHLDPGQHVAASPPDADGFVFAAASPDESRSWDARPDSFSTYRAGFEVRTYRLCRRVLVFHHFPAELGVDDYLVRSTDFEYRQSSVATYLAAVSQSGYVLRPELAPDVRYLKASMPPVEFEYSDVIVDPTIHTLDPDSLAGVPNGIDGAAHRWVDLDGDGLGGVLTEQGEGWFYKRNTSQLFVERVAGVDRATAHLGPVEAVAERPAMALAAGAQFMDLAGDGRPDLVHLDGPGAGLYERDDDGGWAPFRPFQSPPAFDPADPNLRFLDLDGDGHADALITRDDALTWHASLAEDGFGPERRTPLATDDEHGPRLVFADGTETVVLADMSGDGLSDLVRIRNGAVSYWPNLGHGRFGSRVAMDDAPLFDAADRFDARRIRLLDVDGSGTTDIAYVGADGVTLHFNQAGNGWGAPQPLTTFPRIDDVASVSALDLLGNGTGCLAWSSPLEGSAGRSLRYVDLMGGQKPHLLIRVVNNLGAETHIQYAPSTRFYLRDRQAGRPWITRLPFPVQVVERIDTYDRISRNRFVTRYAYHHGFFDGVEREFRGFGMVEQFDTEEFAALKGSDAFPDAENVDEATHVPPVLTRTWFHTGAFIGGERMSRLYQDEYYRPPGLAADAFEATLLPDATMPPGLDATAAREACRALKGSMLHQEVYALDGTERQPHPYTVLERSMTVRATQPLGSNRHPVFHPRPGESLTYHHEREPADPRIQHALTLEVDGYGNATKEVAAAYGRLQPDPSLPTQADRDTQAARFVTYTDRRHTDPVDDVAARPDDYCVPLACDAATYELTGYPATGPAGRYRGDDFVQAAAGGLSPVFDTEIAYEAEPTAGRQRRLIERIRTLYRADDLSALLPLGELQPRRLAGEIFRLTLTDAMIVAAYERDGVALLPNPAAVLGSQGPDGGGFVSGAALAGAGLFPADGTEDGWWLPSGRTLLSPNSSDTPAQELAHATGHFFLTHRTRDPFHTPALSTENFVAYDAHDLLVLETRDALGNRVTAGERTPAGSIDPTTPGNDYRTLKPFALMDANRNRLQVSFDARGMVVGTAVMGKPEEDLGDTLDGFVADLPDATSAAHLADPTTDPGEILGAASTRVLYDVFAYWRTRDDPAPEPTVAYTLARETHDADLGQGEESRYQHSFTYSDGFNREIQRRLQAEPGPVADGGGGPVVDPRWVASGWTIFNNKGKPVRQYEPAFSASHAFEFGAGSGVSPILFYDPVERLTATLHPDHSYDKVRFETWRKTTWDRNDTVLLDPRTDPDVAPLTAAYFAAVEANPAVEWKTWHGRRDDGALGPEQQAAAAKTAAHAGTPFTAHFDGLGRPFLTLADLGPDPATGEHVLVPTRTDVDIQGNPRVVRDGLEQAGDPLGRIVVRARFDMRGDRIAWTNLDAGQRWLLNDALGRPIRSWTARGHTVRTGYDPLRRGIRVSVLGIDPADPAREVLVERRVHGEALPVADAEAGNLRTQLYLHLDQAGATTNDEVDFKGNPLRATRRLTSGVQYRGTVDWSDIDQGALPATATGPIDLAGLDAALAARLEPDRYVNEATYDALSRPVTLTSPHTAATPATMIRPAYNEANLLERLDANLRGEVTNGQPAWTPFITGAEYDARGQRVRLELGNGVATTYAYDPETFRLVAMRSRRPAAAFPDDCVTPPHPAAPGCDVQNVVYTYDPIGNITRIRDDAQQTIYFANQRVEPSTDFRYDPLYRLVEASGREHLGQAGGAPIPHSAGDTSRFGIAWGANDGSAMGRYTEEYVFDVVGNLLEMQHRGTDPANPGWTRTYTYAETSLIEDGSGGALTKTSNRLSQTSPGGVNPAVERYTHDAHGNVTRMPHLGGTFPAPNVAWDERDQLQSVDLGGGGAAYYVYDAAGRRVRKVWEKTATLVEERLYLGGLEIFRRRQGAERLERETLHVMDGRHRVALVESRTVDTAGTDTAPARLIRFQLSNQVDSANLELDAAAAIVSYEEFSPFGSTTYEAVRSVLETPKRYRFAGKERDEESGFVYHGARYYAPWLGRWTSPDPGGTHDGLNVFAYVGGNPIVILDPDGRDGGYALKPSPEYRLKLDPKVEATIKLMQMRGQLPLVPTTPSKPPEPKVDLFPKNVLDHVAGEPKPQPKPNPATTPTTTPEPDKGLDIDIELPKLKWDWGDERNKLTLDLPGTSLTYKHSNPEEDTTVTLGTDLSLETSRKGVTTKFTWDYSEKLSAETKFSVSPRNELKLSLDSTLEFHVGFTHGKMPDLPLPSDVKDGADKVEKGLKAVTKYNNPIDQFSQIKDDQDVKDLPKGVKPFTKLVPSDEEEEKPAATTGDQPAERRPVKPYDPAWNVDAYVKPTTTTVQVGDEKKDLKGWQAGVNFTFSF